MDVFLINTNQQWITFHIKIMWQFFDYTVIWYAQRQKVMETVIQGVKIIM